MKPSTLKDISFAAQSTKPLPNQKVNGKILHSWLRHTGIDIIRQLPKEVNKAVVKNTTTVEYKTYAVSKAYKEISERTLNKIAN